MEHFLCPVFSSSLTTSVVINKTDFESSLRWNPRWMNCYNKDFFLMLSHETPEIWYIWLWMLGTPEEAENYYYDIQVSKGHNKKIGSFSVASVRLPVEKIFQREDVCMNMTDYQVKWISQIRDSMLARNKKKSPFKFSQKKSCSKIIPYVFTNYFFAKNSSL